MYKELDLRTMYRTTVQGSGGEKSGGGGGRHHRRDKQKKIMEEKNVQNGIH